MNSNDTDLPNDNVGAAADATDTAAPKRKRAPAKPKVVAETAPEVVVVAPAEVSAEPKPRAPRKTAAKKSASKTAAKKTVAKKTVAKA